MWAGVLLMGTLAVGWWFLRPDRRLEGQALLSLFFLLYLNAWIMEMFWRRTRRKAGVTLNDFKEICQAASQADPVSVLNLIQHVCEGTAAEVRFALIALSNIGAPAVGFLVVRCEQSPAGLQGLLRPAVGQMVGETFESTEALTRWWQANRLAFQLSER